MCNADHGPITELDDLTTIAAHSHPHPQVLTIFTGRSTGHDGFNKKPDRKAGIICGISTSNSHMDGQVTCGVPLYRNHETGEQFIMPLFLQPQKVSRGFKTDADQVASEQLQKEALELLKKFLGPTTSESTPESKSDSFCEQGMCTKQAQPIPDFGGDGHVTVYPIPDPKSTEGYLRVPDLGPPLASGSTNVGHLGLGTAFL